ncbi:type I restriction enzyme S subunit [Kroppenstedtia sanguinis]|uniref:restriction endonuclease subunit S n=1 Tax=Kroppenstedtia sanguinis TaxID=1380684 RepID=UPI003D2089F4
MGVEGWEETYLGNVLTLQRGFDITKKQMEPGNFPVISSSGISGTHNESKVEGPGVIVDRKGTLGTVFFIDKDYWPHDTTLWVKDFKGNHPKFIYYFLKTLHLESYNVGSANPTLNRNHVHPIRVSWPSKLKQKQIAAILSALDDKIEINNRMNQTLESIAQALFQSWFVDYEPFRDGEFVESELGLIPKGWEVKTIGEVCTITGGGTPKTKVPEYWENGNILWATPSDMTSMDSSVIFDTSRKITKLGLEKSSAKLLPIGTVLMTSRATIGYSSIAMKEISTNQGFINIICDKDLSNYHLMFWIKYYKEDVEGRANGSTFLEISKKAFKEIKVIVPPIKVQEEYNEIIKGIVEKVYSHQLETQTLQSLRDTLLPKLMSGEIRVPIEEEASHERIDGTEAG